MLRRSPAVVFGGGVGPVASGEEQERMHSRMPKTTPKVNKTTQTRSLQNKPHSLPAATGSIWESSASSRFEFSESSNSELFFSETTANC